MKKIDTDSLKKCWLAAEKQQQTFKGWDFSYLQGKYIEEQLPWNYQSLVNSLLTPEMELLDMGTGGGELLLSFHHPYRKTSVTEGWQKNYNLLIENLLPKGVSVKFVQEDDRLDFTANSFDIVLNSHESFSSSEVKRVLKPGGYFITQQVGDLNGLPLSSKIIPNFKKDSFSWHLSKVASDLEKAGFSLLFQNEFHPYQKFFSMDGLIYYLKTISWEFPGFTIENNFSELLAVYEELLRNGYIYNREHRFILVAQLNSV